MAVLAGRKARHAGCSQLPFGENDEVAVTLDRMYRTDGTDRRARDRARRAGPKKLPEMGKSLGKGMREFKDSLAHGNDHAPEDADRIAA